MYYSELLIIRTQLDGTDGIGELPAVSLFSSEGPEHPRSEHSLRFRFELVRLSSSLDALS